MAMRNLPNDLLLTFSSPNPSLALLFIAFAELNIFDLLCAAHHQKPGRGSHTRFPRRFAAFDNASCGESQSLISSFPDQPYPQLAQVPLAKPSLAAERDRKDNKQQSGCNNSG